MLALFIANNMEVRRMSTVTETVTDLVTPILDEHHFYLYDI